MSKQPIGGAMSTDYNAMPETAREHKADLPPNVSAPEGQQPALLAQRDQPHSIELHRDAKGAYSFTIKLYWGDDDLDSYDEIVDNYRAIDQRLTEMFCRDEVAKLSAAFELGRQAGIAESKGGTLL